MASKKELEVENILLKQKIEKLESQIGMLITSINTPMSIEQKSVITSSQRLAPIGNRTYI